MSGPWYGPIANNGKLWHSMLSNCSHPSYSYSRFQSDVKPSKLVRPRRHSSFYPFCSSHPFRDTEVRHTAMCMLTICSVSASLRLTSPKCEIGAIFLVISAWIRYAGTTGSLSSSGAYGLLIFASVRQYINTVDIHCNIDNYHYARSSLHYLRRRTRSSDLPTRRNGLIWTGGRQRRWL